MPRFAIHALVASCAIILAGCSRPVAPTEIVRPVRILVLASSSPTAAIDFSGEIRPRIESRLAFRVGGKILRRNVDVGALVKRGQVLAELDPVDLQLARASANAQLVSAQTDLNLADADLKRYTELRAKGFIGPAELERHQSSYATSKAHFDEADATHRIQSNQANYAALVADVDGVVTGVDAEAGQVVTAGQAVVRVAQTAEREVVFGIPEDKVALLQAHPDISVRVWSNPAQPFGARIREISPSADPATRTFTVRASLPGAPAFVLMGMTATVTISPPAVAGVLTVPLSALYRSGEATVVWVVDPSSLTVTTHPVMIGGALGNQIIIVSGVAAGQWIVTAGVNQLEVHQKVTILKDAGASPDAPSSAVVAPSAKVGAAS